MPLPSPVHPLRADCFEIRVDPRAPAVPQRRAARLPWIRIHLGSAVIVAALTYLARGGPIASPEPIPPASRPPAELAAPAPVWQPIPKPAPLYALDAPDLKGLAANLEARRHASGGREDTLRFGAFEDEAAPHLRVRLSRLVGDGGPPPRFFIDLARLAADAGLAVVRTRQSAMVATKFGPVEAAEVELSGATGRTCLGFRFLHPEVSFRFSGWLCGGGAKPAGPAALACLIDAVTLAGPADDPTLKVMFAQGERRRSESCGAGPRVAAAVRKAS